jgi:nitroimidazol reductase NimA-like FMN-containing flavoprotein (pyridoxamine 5'-phosphate oxidase superfamily)
VNGGTHAVSRESRPVIDEMSPAEIDEFMLTQKVGRVGCHSDGETYVIPVIFARHDDCLYVYTTEGKKVEMMRKNARVCFEVDEYLVTGGWRSVIVQGTYEELHDADARRALEIISDRVPSTNSREQDRGSGRVPVAFRVRVTEMTGRKVQRS